jgi:hypothetical protein
MLEHHDYQEAQELFNTKVKLTAEEAKLIQDLMPAKAKEYLFYHSWDNTYLNLYLYSEVEHHEREYRKEIGF